MVSHTNHNTCVLTLSSTTTFRLFQMEAKFSKNIENTMGKGGITRYEQFLLFPECFQKTCAADTGLVWERVNDEMSSSV